MPHISVIMSVFNEQPHFLETALESILKQTFRDFEFLIVNDGSNQKITEILTQYANRDSRVRLLKNEKNIGLTKSLNVAIREAKGEYIARMDSDDIALSNRFQQQLSTLKQGFFDLICGNYLLINENSHPLREKILILPTNIRESLMKGNIFIHATFFGKRDVFLEYYDETFRRAQDYEFLLRIIAKGYRLGLTEKSILQYRIHTSAISAHSAKEQEWYAIKARWRAITKYGYSKKYYVYLIRSFFILLLPYRLKKILVLKQQ